MANIFRKFTLSKFVIFIVILIFGVQIVSLMISSLFQNVPIFKGGTITVILGVFLTFVALVQVVFKGNWDRTDFLGLLFVGGLTVLAYIYLPKLFPELFSIFGNHAVESAKQLQSILGLP